MTETQVWGLALVLFVQHIILLALYAHVVTDAYIAGAKMAGVMASLFVFVGIGMLIAGHRKEK